jgi:hypothetical protein
MSLKKCSKCNGVGSVGKSRVIRGGGLFGWREQCGSCDGTGFMPYDPWARPIIALVTLIVAYFVWQLFIR